MRGSETLRVTKVIKRPCEAGLGDTKQGVRVAKVTKCVCDSVVQVMVIKIIRVTVCNISKSKG